MYFQKCLELGDFNENVQKFSSLLIKSETLKEVLAKLKGKFKDISVQFSARISYNNNSSQTANLDHHQNIQGGLDSVLYLTE